MPVQRLALDIASPRNLEIRWKGDVTKTEDYIQILFDGQLIGLITNIQELQAGKNFTLPDTSIIRVQLGGKNILVFRNGRCLNDLFGKNREISKINSNVFLFAALNLIVGIFYYFGFELERNLTNALISLGLACGYVLVALWLRKRFTTSAVIIYLTLITSTLIAWAFWDQHISLVFIVEIIMIINGGISVIRLLHLSKKLKEEAK